MINTMFVTTEVLNDLLTKYGIDIEDDDVGQDVINAYVCIDNAYHGYDDWGKQVGTDTGLLTAKEFASQTIDGAKDDKGLVDPDMVLNILEEAAVQING